MGAVLSVSLIVWALALFDLTLLPRISTPFLIKLAPKRLVGVGVAPDSTLLTSADPGGDSELWVLDRDGGRVRATGVPLPAMHGDATLEKLTLRATMHRDLRVEGDPVDVEDWPGSGPTLFAVSSPRRSPVLRLYSLSSGRQVLESKLSLPPQESDRRDFFVARWSGPRPDLFVVDRDANQRKPDSHRLWTIRAFSGESGFGKAVLDSRIKRKFSSKLSEAEWWMDIGFEHKRQAKPNLILITRGRDTGTGQTEVHILSGKRKYHDFSLHIPTELPDRLRQPFLFRSERHGGAVMLVRVEGGVLRLVPVPLP
jgi:hypothetical protein